MVLSVTAELVGVLSNVTDVVRANMELFQLSGTSLQTPCATPGVSLYGAAHLLLSNRK